MLVSVIIPAFNAELWIEQTIQSVLGQTYANLEIVIVDDGSTDETVSVAKKVLGTGKFPYRIVRQANAGLSSARNTGLESARGTWVQLLDADDLLHPKKIELQINECATYTSTDVVYSDWQRLVQQGDSWIPSELRRPMIGDNVLADLLMDKNWQQVGSQLFNKATLINVGGYDRRAEPVEDMEMCLRIAMAGGYFRKALSDRPLFFYRDRTGSLSKMSSVRRHVERCISNAKMVERHVRNETGIGSRYQTLEAIINIYFAGARYFAGRDWGRFEELVTDIEGFRPGFVPGEPGRLRMLSRVIGYRRAERLAALHRNGKALGLSVARALFYKTNL